jgi:uncharacterized membrane protein YgcG
MNTILLLVALAIPAHGTGYVNDTAAMLTPDQVKALNATLIAFRDKTTIEFAVLTIPSLEGEDLRGFANKVFQSWGIGLKGTNNGLLLLWAIKERKVRIEVGYGLEAQMTDGRTGDIIRDSILPQFRGQHWNEGLSAGVAAVIAQLEIPPAVQVADDVATPASSSQHSLVPWIIGFFVFSGICGVVGMLIAGRRRRIAEEEAEERRLRYESADAARRRTLKTVTEIKRRPEPPTYTRSERDYVPIYVAPTPAPTRSNDEPSYRSRSSDDSSFGSSDSSASFSGGSSGGGGADGSY